MTNTNNPSDNNQSVTITPSEVSLSSSSQEEVVSAKGSIRMFFFICLLLLLSIVVFMVYIALPQEDAETEIIDVRSTSKVSDDKEPALETKIEGDSLLPPFEESERQRARKKAQTQLGEFVKLQIRLEDEMNVSAWGQVAYDSILEQANQADQRFLEEAYDESLKRYEAAAMALEQLTKQGEDLFAIAINKGLAALSIREKNNALKAFSEAIAIMPGDLRASEGLSRAKLIPEILDLMLQSERAELQGDIQSAHAYLKSIMVLDPLSAGIIEKIQVFDDLLSDQQHRDALSKAFGALENQDFDNAETLFRSILKGKNDNPEALAGLQQTIQRKTLARIQSLKKQATRSEDTGEWREALLAYEAALQVDGSLTFAREGKSRLQNFIRTSAQIETHIADPNALSSDEEYANAQDLMKEASRLTGRSQHFDDRLSEFEQILGEASTPISLILLSDNATDIRINKVGPFGIFSRSVISLRPGRYTLVGSRDGCRDIRKNIVVAKGMDPVTIACNERI